MSKMNKKTVGRLARMGRTEKEYLASELARYLTPNHAWGVAASYQWDDTDERPLLSGAIKLWCRAHHQHHWLVARPSAGGALVRVIIYPDLVGWTYVTPRYTGTEGELISPGGETSPAELAIVPDRQAPSDWWPARGERVRIVGQHGAKCFVLPKEER